MLIICVFQFRGVDDGIVRPQDREGEGDQDHRSHGISQSGKDGILVELGATVSNDRSYTEGSNAYIVRKRVFD